MSSTFMLNDKYKVNKKRIGKGAFSTVYKATNIEDNKIYAIKEITLDGLNKAKK